MGNFSRFNVYLVFITVVLFSCVSVYECAKKQVGVARKEDIPYIKCQVCEKLTRQLFQQVQSKKAQISPKKISELQIIEIAENICNLKKQEADWILKIDIVEQGDKLELVEQDSEGQCNSECKTIERACQEAMGYYDTDVAEFLYNNKPSIESLTKFLCKDLSKACSTKPPPVPKDRTPGEPFAAKSAKEAEMEKLLKSMEGMPGAPGMKMYSREDLMNNMNIGNEDADEDDDDDEEAEMPSKLGKVLRAKENAKGDWKTKIKTKVKETGTTLRKQADQLTNQVRQWWRRTKANQKKKSSKPIKGEF